MHRLLIAVLVAAVLATTASAATAPGPLYWPSAQVQQLVLKGPGGSNRWFLNPSVMSPSMLAAGYLRVKSATCTGVGTAHAGTYASFSCALTWSNSSDNSGTINDLHLWARGGPGQHVGQVIVCASDRTIADCPPPAVGNMLPGDPRAPGRPSMGSAAKQLTLSALKAKGTNGVSNLICQAKTAFVYGCTWTGGASTVDFVKGKSSWSTKVVLG